MGFSKTVHHRNSKNPSAFLKVTPYVLIRERDSLSYYLQDGRFYYEDGTHVNQPPEWAIKAADDLSDKVKKQVNWVGEPKKRGRPPKQEKVTEDGDSQPDSAVDSEGRQ